MIAVGSHKLKNFSCKQIIYYTSRCNIATHFDRGKTCDLIYICIPDLSLVFTVLNFQRNKIEASRYGR